MEIIAVIKTKMSTSGGFVDFPSVRLKATAIKVIAPMRTSVKANIIIPTLSFIEIWG
jgi:hypothetical protein